MGSNEIRVCKSYVDFAPRHEHLHFPFTVLLFSLFAAIATCWLDGKPLTSTFLLPRLCCSSVSQLGKMRLLDVGSCFNPFLKFDEFLTVGIDIVPAVEVCVPVFFFILDTN